VPSGPGPLPQKELKEIERDKASGVTIKVVGASLQKLVGYVKGTYCMRDTLEKLRSLRRQNVTAAHYHCYLLHTREMRGCLSSYLMTNSANRGALDASLASCRAS